MHSCALELPVEMCQDQEVRKVLKKALGFKNRNPTLLKENLFLGCY